MSSYRAIRGASQPATILAEKALGYLDGLYSYAMTLARNQAGAEDLVQETYLHALRAFSRLAPDSNLKAWLYTILRNQWLNQVRHDKSGPNIVEFTGEEESFVAVEPTSMNDAYASYVSWAQCHDVRAAVNNLPDQFREVIVLRDFEGLSYQEIAVILGVPPGTVMSRLGRARERLRQALSQWDYRSTGGADTTQRRAAYDGGG